MSASADQGSKLGQGERRVLHFIHHGNGVTQKEICEKFDVNKAAVARQCASLEEKGFIKRERNENDGRSFLLFPTEKAEDFKQEHINAEEQIYSRLFKGLDSEDMDQLEKLVSKICAQIDAEHTEHGQRRQS